MNRNEFIKRCQAAEIELKEDQIRQLEDYMALLIEWNQKMNLTSITEPEEIWEKHFWDSIAPFAGLEPNSLCDVGSGAGFPGIPVQIVYPQMRVCLVEPLAKRCRFLSVVKEQLGLDLTIYNQRAEDFVKEHRESFSLVSARAVARLTLLLELCLPLVKPGGLFIALKGKNGYQELEAAQIALDILGACLEKENQVQVEQAAHINFYFRKVAVTPKKYPRAYGQIKKKPLGE